jgi:hypothetical protein
MVTDTGSEVAGVEVAVMVAIVARGVADDE